VILKGGGQTVRVWIKLLSTYRRYLPPDAQGSAYSLEVPVGIRIEELRALLPIPTDESQVILVNGRTPVSGQVLEEGDMVALFPSMAGG
jgi:molybdopterin converting factor small subunit